MEIKFRAYNKATELWLELNEYKIKGNIYE